MQPFYRHLIKSSWTMARQHLFLWPLAFFASIVLGAANSLQILFDIVKYPSENSLTLTALDNNDFLTSTFIGWNTAIDQIPWTTLSLADFPKLVALLLLLILILAITVIAVSSAGGLFYAINALFKRQKPKLMESFKKGLDKFWLLFGIVLIYDLGYLIFFYLLLTPLQTSLIFWRWVVVFFILIPIIIIVGFVKNYSLFYVIIYKKKLKQAIYDAWLLFRANWIISIETALLVTISFILLYLVLALVFLPIVGFFFTFFGSLLVISDAAFQLVAMIAIITIMIILAIFITFFTIFHIAIWINVFNKLTTGKYHSKIQRSLSHLLRLHKKVS